MSPPGAAPGAAQWWARPQVRDTWGCITTFVSPSRGITVQPLPGPSPPAPGLLHRSHMLPEHGQLMQYDVQDTSTSCSSYTHGSATGMVRWQPLCRICTRLHATRAERAAEATSARVASTGTAESGSSCCSQLVSYHICAVCGRGSGGEGRRE